MGYKQVSLNDSVLIRHGSAWNSALIVRVLSVYCASIVRE